MQTPVKATALKTIPGKDRPDYIIAELESPIFWIDKEKEISTDIGYVVLCSRYKGQEINKDMKDTILAIAYVTDDSILNDVNLSFEKCQYVAIGKANGRAKWRLFG